MKIVPLIGGAMDSQDITATSVPAYTGTIYIA